ncbi:hypothetical protein ACTXT7_010862 [Hymenolepis weldensis]
MIDAVAEADRWRAARLAASQSPPPLPSASSLSFISAINSDQRRRRISSGGGLSQQQVVSTTSRLSPDMAEAAANAEALLRRFILSPLYRAHWRSSSEVFYFRTISLPFLRNQGISGNGAVGDKMHSAASFIVNESTSVFSPTSSFENLLLLNYHCILGKVPGDSLLESISSCESTVFDAVTLRVAQKRAYLSPLKSATNTISSNHSSKNVNSSSPNSSIEHLAKVFCFDNIFSEDGCDYNSEDSKKFLRLLGYTVSHSYNDSAIPSLISFPRVRLHYFSLRACVFLRGATRRLVIGGGAHLAIKCSPVRATSIPHRISLHLLRAPNAASLIETGLCAFSEFSQDHHYRFSEESEHHQRITTPSRTPSYSSAHLAPVDIDWIDQTLPFDNANQSTTTIQSTPQSQLTQQRPRKSSGISRKINYANTAAAPVLFCIALFPMKWFGSKREWGNFGSIGLNTSPVFAKTSPRSRVPSNSILKIIEWKFVLHICSWKTIRMFKFVQEQKKAISILTAAEFHIL